MKTQPISFRPTKTARSLLKKAVTALGGMGYGRLSEAINVAIEAHYAKLAGKREGK